MHPFYTPSISPEPSLSLSFFHLFQLPSIKVTYILFAHLHILFYPSLTWPRPSKVLFGYKIVILKRGISLHSPVSTLFLRITVPDQPPFLHPSPPLPTLILPPYLYVTYTGKGIACNLEDEEVLSPASPNPPLWPAQSRFILIPRATELSQFCCLLLPHPISSSSDQLLPCSLPTLDEIYPPESFIPFQLNIIPSP